MLCQELQLASVLGTLSCITLKAEESPAIYGTDASPDGAGIVSCTVGQKVAQELLRLVDFHTRLLLEVGACLHTVGIGSEEPEFLISADYGGPETSSELLPSTSEISLPSCSHAPLKFDAEAHALFTKFALASSTVRNLGLEAFRLDC